MVISRTPIDNGIDFFSKDLIRTPVTKTTSNITGDTTLTDGTPINFKGDFHRRTDSINPSKAGFIEGADAILLVKTTITINKNDKITYNNEDFRVFKTPVLRTLGATQIYYRCDCVKI